MVKLLTKPSTESTAVESDPEVVAAREAYEGFFAQKAAWEVEWRDLGSRLNPNSRSEDHRSELTIAERIRAEERQRELVPLLRLIPADIQLAAEGLAAARRRAYDARYPVARRRVEEKLATFYRALEALCHGEHAELVAECATANALLRSPVPTGLPVPPPFDPLMLAWPELREDADGPVTQRRAFLARAGWL